MLCGGAGGCDHQPQHTLLAQGSGAAQRACGAAAVARPRPPTRDAVVEQGKQVAVQLRFQVVVPQVGGGGQAEGHAAHVQVAQQPLCGAGCSSGARREREEAEAEGVGRSCSAQRQPECCSTAGQPDRQANLHSGASSTCVHAASPWLCPPPPAQAPATAGRTRAGQQLRVREHLVQRLLAVYQELHPWVSSWEQ